MTGSIKRRQAFLNFSWYKQTLWVKAWSNAIPAKAKQTVWSQRKQESESKLNHTTHMNPYPQFSPRASLPFNCTHYKHTLSLSSHGLTRAHRHRYSEGESVSSHGEDKVWQISSCGRQTLPLQRLALHKNDDTLPPRFPKHIYNSQNQHKLSRIVTYCFLAC